MTLHEPATFATDCLLAAFAGWLAWRLRRVTPAGNHAAQWWSLALVFTAASALVGGAYHGFAPNFSPALDAVWWRLTLLSINLLSVAMGVSWVHEIIPPPHHRVFFIAITVKSLAFGLAVLRRPEFVVAMVDYGSTLLAWFVVALVLRREWCGWMLGAIGFSALAGAVQQFRWAPAAWFNHNDLYHLIQMGALAAFHRAARGFGAASR